MADTLIAGGHRAPTDHYDAPRSDAEDRMGVEPVDVLLANRATIVDALAPLWAEYGSGGIGEHRLSAERCRIVGLLRAMAAAKGEKITEAALEAGSKEHPEYIGMMAQQTTDRARFFRLQEDLRAIDFRLNRGQALLRAYASEPKV